MSYYKRLTQLVIEDELYNVLEARRHWRGPEPGQDYPKGHMSRGSGPVTQHTRLGGNPLTGDIWRGKVLSRGTRGSSKEPGKVSYTRVPRLKPGQVAKPGSSRPAPIEGRLRDALRKLLGR